MSEFSHSEEELLVLLSMLNLTETENQKLQALLSKPIDWNEFLNLCDINQTSPLIYYRLLELNQLNNLPLQQIDQLKESALRIKTDNQNRINSGVPLIQAMKEAGVRVIILKGMYFAEAIYKNSFYKKMNDIDILIPKEDAYKALDVLSKLQFFSAGEILGEDAEKQIEISHHFPPFFSKDLNCMVGTHWGLINPNIGIKPDYEGMWTRSKDFNFHGVDVKSLSPTDHLHHLCIHLSPYKCGIKEVGDIYNLIRYFGKEIDFNLLKVESIKAKSEDAVWMSLLMAKTYDPSLKVQSIIDLFEEKANYLLKQEIRYKTSSLSVLIRSRTTYLTKIDKAYTRFKSTKKPLEKILAYQEIWKLLLFPPDNEALKLSHLSKDQLLSVPRAKFWSPLKIVQAFSHDLGAHIFFLLLLHTTYSTGKSVVKGLMGAKLKGYEDFAKDLGLTTDQLDALREKLE
jgi:hypothetical protein